MCMVQLGEQTRPHTTLPPTCNAIMLSDTTKKYLAQFHHASLGSPVPSTLFKAIDAGFLSSFPRLTTQLVKKHLPKSIQTGKVHMDQERKNLQSTKRSKANPIPPINTHPAAPPTRTNLFICAIVEATDKINSDLTGKFPVQSALGNKYTLIVYHYDANAILAEPLKDRTAKSIASAHQRIYDPFTR